MTKRVAAAAARIAADFLPIEQHGEQLVSARHRLVATMYDARRSAGVAFADASAILSKMEESTALTAQANARHHEAHVMLAELCRKHNLDPRAYGDTSDCKEVFLSQASPLRAVS